MKSGSTFFSISLIAGIICANANLKPWGDAHAEERSAKVSGSHQEEREPTKPESAKENNECKNNCDTELDWCMKSNISTDRFELCENSYEKCIRGCGSNK